jgi:hypothetical protein
VNDVLLYCIIDFLLVVKLEPIVTLANKGIFGDVIFVPDFSSIACLTCSFAIFSSFPSLFIAERRLRGRAHFSSAYRARLIG